MSSKLITLTRMGWQFHRVLPVYGSIAPTIWLCYMPKCCYKFLKGFQVEYIHNHKVAPNFYNNEQSLRSVVRTAFLGAIDHYIEIQELPSGKDYADLVFIPRRNTNKPVMIIELKWNKSAHTAIDQIKKRDYPEILKELSQEVLIVGITYDEKTKKHSCIIETYNK